MAMKEMKTLEFPDGNVYVIIDESKVAKDQGKANSGKILGVGTDGNVTLVDMPSAGTGGSDTPSITVDSALSTTSINPVQNKVVTSALNNRLPKSGGTLTGYLTLNADPSNNLHAATKQYVDNAVQAAIGAAIGGSY